MIYIWHIIICCRGSIGKTFDCYSQDHELNITVWLVYLNERLLKKSNVLKIIEIQLWFFFKFNVSYITSFELPRKTKMMSKLHARKREHDLSIHKSSKTRKLNKIAISIRKKKIWSIPVLLRPSRLRLVLLLLTHVPFQGFLNCEFLFGNQATVVFPYLS